jgi:hypothetical protein
MANDKVCIGGIDLDKSIYVRLLDINGYHESRENCPYKIREIYEIEYIQSPRPLPHSEDVRVLSRNKTGELKQNLSMLDTLFKNNFTVYSGNIRETFEGKLNHTNSGTFYISKENVPQNSTCFWICDRNLIRDDYHNKIRYNYRDDDIFRRNHRIVYIGLEENPAQIISRNTLIRLSLAHWWSPQDSEDEERCYLQLSGWY